MCRAQVRFLVLAAALFGLGAAAPNPSGIVSLIGYQFIARGCPIDTHYLLTSRHVATVDATPYPRQNFAAWSDESGASGIVWSVDYDYYRDLALMQSETPFRIVYARAGVTPVIGETLVMAGYEYTSRLETKAITVRLLNIVAGHLILSKAAERGWSGSCVLNSRNEVVGVYQWSMESKGVQRGLASAVYGPWGAVGWTPPQPTADPSR